VTCLSVNVNKIATLRNSRGGDIPNLVEHARRILDAGAHGITVHPREDQRHIRTGDVFDLRNLLAEYNRTADSPREYNIEGEPSRRFLDLVLEAGPDQATLVPVRPGEITSDHGFRLKDEAEALRPIVAELKSAGVRVALFLETDVEEFPRARDIGADRVELYTGPFAVAFDRSPEEGRRTYAEYERAAEAAASAGLGINAGHDLDTRNLTVFAALPRLAEVSIGHRLLADALVWGLERTVREYLRVLRDGLGPGVPVS
jgi:pyridoxine 5-phosphate synthase